MNAEGGHNFLGKDYSNLDAVRVHIQTETETLTGQGSRSKIEEKTPKDELTPQQRTALLRHFHYMDDHLGISKDDLAGEESITDWAKH